jgi:sugar diacid utilization regulator
VGRAVALDGGWACAVLAGPELLGCMALSGRPELSDPERRLFERTSVVCALLMLLRRSVTETENRIRGELITDLLSAPDRDPAALVERARHLGAELTRPHMVLVADAPPTVRGRLVAAGRAHLFGTDGICGEHAGRLILFRPADACDPGGPGAAARQAAAELTHSLGVPVTVAGSGPAEGPAGLAAAYGEAERCLQALRVLGREGGGGCASDLGFLGVVLGTGHDVEGFVGATLGPLLAWDAQRGTDLIGTLDAYFACGSNLARAKDELHIHVNTLCQRLERVEKLLGARWSRPDNVLELQLALRLRHLAMRQNAAQR